jgi:hypothetical protein
MRHLLIPIFGLVANLACMAFYLIGPFMGYGTKMEPLLALGIARCGRSTAGFTSRAPGKGRPHHICDQSSGSLISEFRRE